MRFAGALSFTKPNSVQASAGITCVQQSQPACVSHEPLQAVRLSM
jgi:hypothetical protein